MKQIVIENGLVDVTDPCYDRGEWCSLWDVKVRNGEYEVDVDELNELTKSIRMMLKGEEIVKVKDIGVVGVDAGLCGFFVKKPTFNNAEWKEICGKLKEMDERGEYPYEIPTGVFANSGHGDGEYPVRAYYDCNDEIVGLEIVFIV